MTKWLGDKRKAPNKHYVSDFIDHYMDPTELTGRITSLARQFPQISEIVDLPNKTNGYRRAAQAQFGTAAASTFYVSSKAFGSEGGNDLSVALVKPDVASSPLSVKVTGKDIVVNLATDAVRRAHQHRRARSSPRSTPTPAAAALVTAYTYRGNAGAGVVAAGDGDAAERLPNAPATVSRAPFQQHVLRIGKQRDGSKVGVFLYCQQHAREWVTPLTCLETAERLLRNYAHRPGDQGATSTTSTSSSCRRSTRTAAHYSFYDSDSSART